MKIFDEMRHHLKESMDPRDFTDKPGYVVVVKFKKGGEEIKYYSEKEQAAKKYADRVNKVNKVGDVARVVKTDGRKMMEAIDPSDTGGAEETSMAMKQIAAMRHYLDGIESSVKAKGDMEEWYQNKLTKANDYLKTLYGYAKGDVAEEVDLEEAFEFHVRLDHLDNDKRLTGAVDLLRKYEKSRKIDFESETDKGVIFSTKSKSVISQLDRELKKFATGAQMNEEQDPLLADENPVTENGQDFVLDSAEQVDESSLRKSMAQLSSKFPERSKVKTKDGKPGTVVSVGKDYVKVAHGNKMVDYNPSDLVKESNGQDCVKSFRDIREAKDVVFSKKIKGMSGEVKKTNKGFVAYIDGDELDTYKNLNDAKKGIEVALKELS